MLRGEGSSAHGTATRGTAPPVAEGLTTRAAARGNGAAKARANGTTNGTTNGAGKAGGEEGESKEAGSGEEGKEGEEAREAALMQSLRARRRLRELLLSGDVAGACAECEVCYPNLMKRNAELRLLLHCQSYIELVREKKLLAAVAYARDNLAPHREAEALLPLMYRGLLHEVVALIAYPDPASAGAAQARLMGREHRERVAEVLNSAVLRELGLDPTCALERLLRQLVATHAAIRDANHSCGEGFRLLGEAASRPV